MHRNRFFGRSRPNNTGNDEIGLMETGMADIPENPSTSGSGQQSSSRGGPPLDPRTGMVSPAAWRTFSGESNLSPGHVGPNTARAPAPPAGPPRIPTSVVAPTMSGGANGGGVGSMNPTVEDVPEGLGQGQQHQRGLSGSQTEDFAAASSAGGNYEMKDLKTR